MVGHDARLSRSGGRRDWSWGMFEAVGGGRGPRPEHMRAPWGNPDSVLPLGSQGAWQCEELRMCLSEKWYNFILDLLSKRLLR